MDDDRVVGAILPDAIGSMNRKRKCESNPGSQVAMHQDTSNPISSRESDDLIKTLSMNDDGAADRGTKSDSRQIPFLPLRRLQLEAVFYPKFDNERAEGSANHGVSIRAQMIERCRTGNGYIEVSLKHSGSLVLWSGRERFYSKNSTANLFTAVAEVLLRQHFHRLSGILHDDAHSSATGEEMYEQCSSYIEQHRLTLSFEVITSVLGDHGARPLQDFIILTAIADRDRVGGADAPTNIFYSTLELIEFAQRFHLPHNDYWIYCDNCSIQALFDVYDNSRETGTTSTVIPALCAAASNTETTPSQRTPTSTLFPSNGEDLSTTGSSMEQSVSDCDFYIQSMYPHAECQGEILEGIVIRFVSMTTSSGRNMKSSTTLERIRRLSQKSRIMLQQFKSSEKSLPSVDRIDLRQLHKESKAAYSRKGVEEFEKRLKELLLQSSNDSGRSLRQLQRFVGKSLTSKEVESYIQSLLHHPNADLETRRIAAVIDAVSNFSSKVVYSIFCEEQNTGCEAEGMNGNSRYICIVHVLHDETFYKYHRLKDVAALPLFRGFSFQLIGGEVDDATHGMSDSICTSEPHGISNDGDLLVDKTTRNPTNDDESLMLKMKFLPYMIRTFACRNGLKVIRQVDGVSAFTNFTNSLLSKWGISDVVRQEWRPFFSGWARYAQLHLDRTDGAPLSASHVGSSDIGDCLPPLSEYCYIDHFEHYQRLYRDGMYKEETASKTLLQGLVVTVSLNADRSGVLADYIAQRLGCTRRFVGLDEINPSTVDDACNPGRGIICNAAIEHGFGKIRKLLKDFADFISIIIFECSEDNLSSLHDNEERKKLAGVLKGWKKTTCARVVDLPYLNTLDKSHLDDKASFRECVALSEFISELERPAVVDTRTGILAFFPMIPGSGKSTFVGNIQDDSIDSASNRSFFIHEGDKTKGKFWPQVKKARRRTYSGIHIADKNAPSSVWGTIGDICAATKALAVPVLPDKAALRTTRVDGYREPDGSVVTNECHVYPFSLWYLAICMARIMQRPEGSHAGKLDKATKRACLIVVKFFSFYRTLSADQFVSSLASVFAKAGALITPALIEVPFFSIDPNVDDLPEDVTLVLMEALRCQFGYDRENVDTTSSEDEYLDDLEIRLREVLDRYGDAILSSTVDVSISRKMFATSLKEKICEADSIKSYDAPPFVKIAAIDVPAVSVFCVLREVYRNEQISDFFDRILCGNDIDEILFDLTYGKAEDLGFVTKTHITLAHCRNMSQSYLRSTFAPHLDSTVELSTHGLLWNDRVMALAVKVSEITSEGKTLPASSNEFVHLTVWIDKDASAVEANNLPRLVDMDEAYRLDFPSYSLQGVVSLWSM